MPLPMKFFKIIFYTVLLGLGSRAKALTNIYTVPQLAAPLYTLGGTARATAMGSAFAGIADDAASLLYNPAGLGWLEMPELGLHHNSCLVESYRETVLV